MRTRTQIIDDLKLGMSRARGEVVTIHLCDLAMVLAPDCLAPVESARKALATAYEANADTSHLEKALADAQAAYAQPFKKYVAANYPDAWYSEDREDLVQVSDNGAKHRHVRNVAVDREKFLAALSDPAIIKGKSCSSSPTQKTAPGTSSSTSSPSAASATT